MRLAPPAPPPAAPAPAPVVRGVRRLPPPAPPAGEPDEAPPRWRFLALGLGLAWVATFVLPANYVWFLCALPHEMGHATLGCLLGHPSAPAIALHGEAWAGIGELRPWLVWLLAAAGAGGGALLLRERRPVAAAACFALAVLIPSLAFTAVADVLISAGGHLGELAFAAWCYHVCFSGGYTGTAQERTAGALAGALVQAQALRLGHGLATDLGAREFYATNGSLGLKNDLLVLAEDLLHCRLETVAGCLVVIAVLVLPLGIAWGHLAARRAE